MDRFESNFLLCKSTLPLLKKVANKLFIDSTQTMLQVFQFNF